MTNATYAIISVLLVSMISFVGLAAFSLSDRVLKLVIFLSIGFAAGALFGDAFIHLIPESFERLQGQTSRYVLLGLFIFFILEKILRAHHHFDPASGHLPKPVGYLNLFADGLHNFVDGILIGSSYLISVNIGIATTVAVVLHEIPQEIGDFGVLLHAGFSKTKALLFNFLSATFAVLGAVVALLAGDASASFGVIMLPIAAGGFIYIAGSDLIPELQQEVTLVKSSAQLAALAGGAGLMMWLA